MTCHIWNGQMVSLLCGSFHVRSNGDYVWIPYTLGAGKWLISCVDSLMIVQGTTLCECLPTCGTGTWLLSSVYTLMFFSYHRSVIMSYHICNRLIFSVSSFMNFQATTYCKWLTTFGISKWLLSCVSRSFHETSNSHIGWISFHIRNRQMACP